MKLNPRLWVSILVFAALGWGAHAQGSAARAVPRVEVAFLNHSPVISALSDADKLLASYGNKIEVVRYDLDSEAGSRFMKSKKMTGHVPIAIFVNGSMDVKLKDRSVRFYSFPQGKGTFMVASGSWTVDDLRAAIDQALGNAK